MTLDRKLAWILAGVGAIQAFTNLDHLESSPMADLTSGLAALAIGLFVVGAVLLLFERTRPSGLNVYIVAFGIQLVLIFVT